METFQVQLVKDHQGLGITIAGYVCEKGKCQASNDAKWMMLVSHYSTHVDSLEIIDLGVKALSKALYAYGDLKKYSTMLLMFAFQ